MDVDNNEMGLRRSHNHEVAPSLMVDKMLQLGTGEEVALWTKVHIKCHSVCMVRRI